MTMDLHWKIILTAMWLLGDMMKVMFIGKPREPYTKAEAAVSVLLSAIGIIFVWWKT